MCLEKLMYITVHSSARTLDLVDGKNFSVLQVRGLIIASIDLFFSYGQTY